MNLPRLSRATHGRPAAPVRIVHLGLGNFTRAHQAWYTEHAPDAAEWGIAAFTGRRPEAADARPDTADALRPQDGLYTLITRKPDSDAFEIVSAVSAVHPASDHETFLDLLSAPATAVLTTTVTEAGYLRGADGGLDEGHPDVRDDIGDLREDAAAPVVTVPGRVVAGLLARRAAGSGPLTMLPCDNLPDNGPTFRRVVLRFAELVDPTLVAWADEHVSWATSMVDRITPGTTDADRELVRDACGYDDAAPVPTEPFSEWVIAGDFPAGRPDWEAAGVRITDDVGPFEQRKLWMLNGSHSLMAYAATILGHETVSDAIADPRVRGWVEEWWAVAAANLELPVDEVDAYREALLQRYSNTRMRDVLTRIAADGSQKVPVRFLPALRLERAAGRLPDGPVRAIGAWVLHLRGHGAPVRDPRADELQAAAAAEPLRDAVANVLAAVAPDLRDDEELVGAVVDHAQELRAEAP